MRRFFPQPITEDGRTIGYIDRVVSLAPWQAHDAKGQPLMRFQSRQDAVAEVRRAWEKDE